MGGLVDLRHFACGVVDVLFRSANQNEQWLCAAVDSSLLVALGCYFLFPVRTSAC